MMLRTTKAVRFIGRKEFDPRAIGKDDLPLRAVVVIYRAIGVEDIDDA
jgi:hypothetical protein